MFMRLAKLSALAASWLATTASAEILPRTATLPAFFAPAADGQSLSLHNGHVPVDLRRGEVIYRLSQPVRVTYLKGGPALPQGQQEAGAKLHDFSGPGARTWRSNIPTYNQAVYTAMWPGVDVVYTLAGNELKTEYRIQRGANSRCVQLQFQGADSIAIHDKALIVTAAGQSIREAAPVIYQIDRVTGVHRAVEGGFRLIGRRGVGLAVDSYDHRNMLVFDPVIGFSTYLGGSGQSQATAIGVDGNGNSIIAGFTTSLDLAPGAVQIGKPQRTTAFVAGLSAAGNQLLFCTYLGGSLDNRAFAIALDRWNNIYVAGTTSSSDFPMLKPVQSSRRGAQDAFIAELNPQGSALVFSTYWGGTGFDQANGIAVDRQGDVYVTGDTQSTDYPVRGGVQAVNRGGLDAFVVKLGMSGSKVIWSTYIGGGLDEHSAAIAVDFTSAVVITGSTNSTDFPTLNAFQSRNAGSQNAFLARFTPAGNALVFSTYLGGSGAAPGLPETGAGVAVDNTAAIYITGTTASTDFPVTSGAFQTTSGGGFLDAFAIKMNPWGGLTYSTYLGGVNADYGCALAVDAAGNAQVAGYTNSADFPSLRGVQNGVAGSYDIFVTKLNAAGSGLIYSTVLGGTLSDSAAAIAVDRYGTVSVSGQSVSTDFAVTSAYQSALIGVQSSVVSRLPVGWTPALFNSAGVWSLDTVRTSGAAPHTVSSFGNPSDVPILGDWSGTGHQHLGIFRDGTWFLDVNGNEIYDPGDRTFLFGQAGDVPLVGDWDGTGTQKAGLFRNGTFILDFSGLISGIATGKTSQSFTLGQSGDIPVVGDWNHLGTSKVGIFRGGQWLLDMNGTHTINGPARSFGQAGDLPLVGDWDGSGLTKAGVYRSGVFLLDYNGNWNLDAYGDLALTFGPAAPYALVQY